MEYNERKNIMTKKTEISKELNVNIMFEMSYK